MTEGGTSHLSKVKANLERRALVQDGIRHFFHNEGFLEVETPLRVSALIPEQYITPFGVNGWFLSTSPEIYMKQLLAAGYGNIFQLCHCFRKGERGKVHQPEFTMLEWYRVGASYMQIINDTERLVFTLANNLNLGPVIDYKGGRIDLTPPWPKITAGEIFLAAAGWDPVSSPDPARFDIDLMNKIIPSFAPNYPMVLYDYPAAMASLARLKSDNVKIAERAEVFIGGLEIANAYSELNDAAEQKQRFQLEIEQLRQAGREDVTVPKQFLEAIANLPECGGAALGVDRLIMLLCDAECIEDVIAFSETV